MKKCEYYRMMASIYRMISGIVISNLGKWREIIPDQLSIILLIAVKPRIMQVKKLTFNNFFITCQVL